MESIRYAAKQYTLEAGFPKYCAKVVATCKIGDEECCTSFQDTHKIRATYLKLVHG